MYKSQNALKIFACCWICADLLYNVKVQFHFISEWLLTRDNPQHRILCPFDKIVTLNRRLFTLNSDKCLC